MRPLPIAALSLLILQCVIPDASLQAAPAPDIPGPTLADDLARPPIPFVRGYDTARPRLLFFASDRETLRHKAREYPELWQAVLTNARRVLDTDSVAPLPQMIKRGSLVHIEFVQSAALAWFVTGDRAYRDGAVRWMLAHCREEIWGAGYRANLDLAAAWYLYHIAIAYDILRDNLEENEANAIRAGLTAHAKAIYDYRVAIALDRNFSYDQNHNYIPVIGALTASLALLGEEPAAAEWIRFFQASLRRSLYVSGEDGYYYEGTAYWSFAMNWHVRGAELLGRATGENIFNHPGLRENWRFGLHLSLPGHPDHFDVGDSGTWKADHQRPSILVNNGATLWRIASATASPESRAVGDFLTRRRPETTYPSAAFLWFDPAGQSAKIEDLPPHHYFKDHGVVAWRSSWGADATAFLFRLGPPEGHAAAAKLERLRDWTMNAGHTHPDIGAFYLYAKGAYLAVGTGYTARKWTRDHNTLLIDGKGQGRDGSYSNEQGVPYAHFDGARIDRVHLSDNYGYASGEFGSAYTRQIENVSLRRSALVTSRWLLLVDDLRTEDKVPRRLTWLCHTDAEFVQSTPGEPWVARLPQDKPGAGAALAVLPLFPSQTDIETVAKETVVMGGKGPNDGALAKRGYHLSQTNRAPSADMRFVNLLVPLGAGEKPPVVEQFRQGGEIAFMLRWPDGTSQQVQLDLKWSGDAGGRPGPARITLR